MPANFDTKTNLTVRRENLAILSDEWNELYHATKSDNPFLSWDWFQSWSPKVNSGKAPCVLVAREFDLLVGIAPFFLEQGFLSFYRDSFLADYAGILIRPGHEKAGYALISHMCKMSEWRSASLESIRSVSRIVPILEAQLSAAKLFWRRETICANPRVSTIGNFRAYMKVRKKRLRQEIRTTENHIGKIGEWGFREASDKEEALSIFDALAGFHKKRQTAKIGNSIFLEDVNISFFANLIRSPSAFFKPHLSAIDLNGRIVSAVYSLRCGRSFYYWIPSFDSNIRSVSLGKLHIKCLIELCFDDGTTWFDFMGGEEPYKFQWTDEGYELFRYRIHRNRAAALFGLQKERLLTSLRTLQSRSPLLQGIWHRISKLK